MQQNILQLPFSFFLLMSCSLFGQPDKAGSYIHFRTIEKNDPNASWSGFGGILELDKSAVHFIRDTVRTTCRRSDGKIWFNDSVSAQVIYEYPDSLRLLLNNNYIDYRALNIFSGNKKFLEEIGNYAWTFTSENVSFTLTPEAKKSYVRHGASIYARIDFSRSNQVEDFHLNLIFHAESVTFFGFDLVHGFTTIQLIDEIQDTIKCELYQHGELIKGKLTRRSNASEVEILAIKAKLISKKWIANWSYQYKAPAEIQLIGKGNSYINSRSIQNGQVSFSFFSDGRYHFNDGKQTETGNWHLSADGNYILLKNKEKGRFSLRLLNDSTKNIKLIGIQHVKHKQEFLYGESVVFK